ncbi:MAG: FAD-dependent oxidoreductase [Candidatus Diapherotrites archaeon]|nr:FAD-dependent oxidoreductase [Candidatus Diapherotrites archaeon]
MVYDIIIIGGGPGGLAAAIYATRYEMKALLIAKAMGGELATAPMVDNYPGFPGMTGYDLMKKIEDHAKSFKVEIKAEEAIGITKNGAFKVKTAKEEYEAKAIVLVTGSERRKLKVPGEEELMGKGVSYCATCDGALFKGAVVGVVGGSDSAAKEALLLAEYAKKVYIIYRKPEIRAEPATKKLVYANPKIEIINNANVVKINGEKMLESVDLDTGKNMKLEGLFIEIGGIPASDLAEKLGAKLNEKLEVVINEDCETNVPGLFAAGDVTPVWKQAIVAAGYGSIAAYSAYNYIKSLEAK